MGPALRFGRILRRSPQFRTSHRGFDRRAPRDSKASGCFGFILGVDYRSQIGFSDWGVSMVFGIAYAICILYTICSMLYAIYYKLYAVCCRLYGPQASE